MKRNNWFQRNELRKCTFLVLGPVSNLWTINKWRIWVRSFIVFFVRRRTLTQFSLTPYYRSYFGKKTAAGFCWRVWNDKFGKQVIQNMIQLIKTIIESKENYTDLALGFGLGAKWTQKRIYLWNKRRYW
jgi:hypothetical protein